MFNKNKTKWQPMWVYIPVADNSRKMLFARYDIKTGLFDFKTKTIASSMYSCDGFDIKINPQEIFENLLKAGNNDR